MSNYVLPALEYGLPGPVYNNSLLDDEKADVPRGVKRAFDTILHSSKFKKRKFRYKRKWSGRGYRLRRTGTYNRVYRGLKKLRYDIKRLTPPCQVYRNISSGSVDCAINQVAYQVISLGAEGELDGVLTAAPLTMITNDATMQEKAVNVNVNTGEVAVRFIQIKKILNIKNNNNNAVNITMFWVTPKQNTDQDLVETATDGLHHEGGGSGNFATNPRFSPFMFGLVNKNYKLIKRAHRRLIPGETLITGLKCCKRIFDPQMYDEESISYRARRNVQLVLRIQGDVAHDTTNDALVGTGQCSIDYVSYATHKYTMKGGIVAHQEHAGGDFDTIADDEGVNIDAPSGMEDFDNTE